MESAEEIKTVKNNTLRITSQELINQKRKEWYALADIIAKQRQ